MTPRAVLFDAFGTLVALGVRRRPFAHIAQLAGTANAGELIMTQRLDLAAAASALGVSLTEAGLRRLELDLQAELASLYVYPEVMDTLVALRRRGLRIGVVSNLAEPYGLALRQALPIEPDLWVLSFEVGLVKPDPAIYALACARLGCAPSETLMTGDSLQADYAGAVAAGVTAIHLDRSQADPPRTGVPTISGLDELLSFIARPDAGCAKPK